MSDLPKQTQQPFRSRGRRSRAHPKGRQIDPTALDEVRALLGDRPRRRDLLIEHLHLIQDRFHCLHARHLAALAEEMRLAQAEIYEVASFYAHFDIVSEGETPPPMTIRVCDSLTCDMMGAQALMSELEERFGGQARVIRAPCMGACDRAPVCAVGHVEVFKANAAKVTAAASEAVLRPTQPGTSLDGYLAEGGYSLLRDCLEERRTPDDLLTLLDAGGLRGLGGAGFPTARKWRFVRQEASPRLMAVNADEGEPGTFKDRHYLETDPHRFLEGMLIAAWVVEAQEIYVYLRDEYPAIRLMLLEEIERVEKAGLTRGRKIHLRRGAGAYICGEESAMIESIEGKRGLPRHRPPYVAQVGLFGRPTLVNNVETLYWVRDIVERGPEWFAAQGRSGAKGLRSFSVSGRVREPGVKLAPAGISVRQLIDEFCGGMADGHKLKAYLPGGASGGILPESLADLPLDFGLLEKHGAIVGSHAVVVLSERDNLRSAALNLLRFFEDESCGQCTPCRVGTEKAVKLMEAKRWDEATLRELCAAMADASICGLGQAAPNPILSLLRYFPDEIA